MAVLVFPPPSLSTYDKLVIDIIIKLQDTQMYCYLSNYNIEMPRCIVIYLIILRDTQMYCYLSNYNIARYPDVLLFI